MKSTKARHPNDVREAITKRGVTKADLARRAEVHANTLADVEKPEWNPRWRTLEALCVAADQLIGERVKA
jgi:lambda repressor-like predicted transcriptional regulator